MSHPFIFVEDLVQETAPPADGILSRTIHNDDRAKVVIFGFSAGQELSEHTASMPAILQFLQGEATVTLGDETREARSGSFIHMPAGLTHAIRSRTDTVMLLILLKST